MKPHERTAAIARLRAIPRAQRDYGQEQLLQSLLIADYRWRQRTSQRVAAQLHPHHAQKRSVAAEAAMIAMRHFTLGEPA